MKKRVFNWTICCGLWYLVVFYRMFGFVARRSGGLGNVCHLFAELDPEQPATAIVNFINKVMLGPQQLRKWTQYRRDGEKQNRAHKMVLQWILSVLRLYMQNECFSLGYTKLTFTTTHYASFLFFMFTFSVNQWDLVMLKRSALWSDFKWNAFY